MYSFRYLYIQYIFQAAKTETVGMPYSNTDQENGFLKLLNVPLKQFQPLVKQCTEVLLQITTSYYSKIHAIKKVGNYLFWNFISTFTLEYVRPSSKKLEVHNCHVVLKNFETLSLNVTFLHQ